MTSRDIARRTVSDDQNRHEVLVVVHPGSLGGSLDMHHADGNVEEDPDEIRRRVLDEVRDHEGLVAAVLGDFRGEIKEYRDLESMSWYFDETFEGSDAEGDIENVASEILDMFPRANFTVTGAWVDRDSGCARFIADQIGGDLSDTAAGLEW